MLPGCSPEEYTLTAYKLPVGTPFVPVLSPPPLFCSCFVSEGSLTVRLSFVPPALWVFYIDSSLLEFFRYFCLVY